jgi:hypothetical protein
MSDAESDLAVTPITKQKCRRCRYEGVPSTFPINKRTGDYTGTCYTCTETEASKKAKKVQEPKNSRATTHTRSAETLRVITLDECLQLLDTEKDSAFELDTFVRLPEDPEAEVNTAEIGNVRANVLRDLIEKASDYDWKCVQLHQK